MTVAPRERHPLLVWAWSLVHLDFVGVAFGALFFCLSLTPSLLPRDWLFQGLIGGLNAAIGYGIGAFAGRMVRRFVLRRREWWPPSKRVLYVLKTVAVAVSATACVLMMIPAAAWQRQVSAVIGVEGPNTLGYTAHTDHRRAGRWLCASGWHACCSTSSRPWPGYFIRRWHLHDEMALFIGTAIVVVLVITLINGVLVRGFLAGANRVFQPQNTTTRAGIVQPIAARTVRQPNVFRAMGHAWASRAATSWPPARTPTS